MTNNENKLFTEIFSDYTVNDCLTLKSKWEVNRKLISVLSTASLSETLKLILETKVLSVAITGDDGRCTGVVDIMDILYYLVSELRSVEEWTAWHSIKLEDLLQGVRVSTLCDFSRGDPLLLVGEDTALESLVKFFSSGLVHRALVHKKEGGFEVISQMDIFAFLAERLTNEKNIADKLEMISIVGNLKNRSLQQNDIVTAIDTMTVFDVMKLMKDRSVSAVAIVNQNGKLVGNFSAMDLVQLELMHLSDIGMPVHDYLSKYVKQYGPLAVEGDITVSQAIMVLAMLRIHRVWLVDSNMSESFKPIGVVTMTDLLHMVRDL